MARTLSTPKMTLDVPPPPEPFEGFNDRTFKFLHGLKRNNNKPWFDAHRDDYETYLRAPSRAFVMAMAGLFAEEKLPLIADLRRSLFRINRDIRFSKDKSPYKTHIGIVFGLDDLGEDEWAGMYMSFEPNGSREITSSIGGGVYMPSPPFLKAIRLHIEKEYKTFTKLNRAKTFRNHFPNGITGSSLVRMPKGFDETHPGADFLKKKEFLYGADISRKQLTDESLPQFAIKKIKAALPMLKFLAGKE